MNSIQNKNSKSMAAFLMNDNLEPATRTLDIVRLVFHFCNFVNLTLGGIAFGVGIGYDLTPINVSRNASIIPVQTKFLITGVFVIIHGLIGAYGFVSRQSRSLIVYGCLGLCLLIVGSVAAWSAKTGEDKIIDASRDHFYFRWKSYDEKLDINVKERNLTRVGHSDCECRYTEKATVSEDEKKHILTCWSGKSPPPPRTRSATSSEEQPAATGDNEPFNKDDRFIWKLICDQKYCQMRSRDVSREIVEGDNSSAEIQAIEEQKYYNYACKVGSEEKCVGEDTCDKRCDTRVETFSDKKCRELCHVHTKPYTCVKYVKVLTKHRVVTMYVILFSLSVTQTVCLLCDILFIFWSLKEEADIEIHQTDGKDCKRLSTKLQLLNRFLPCCFAIPKPMNNSRQSASNVALSDIFSASEPESSAVQALNTDSSEHNDPKT